MISVIDPLNAGTTICPTFRGISLCFAAGTIKGQIFTKSFSENLSTFGQPQPSQMVIKQFSCSHLLAQLKCKHNAAAGSIAHV